MDYLMMGIAALAALIIGWLNSDEKAAFCRFIAIITALSIPVAYIVPDGLYYLVAIVWDFLIISNAYKERRNLGKYNYILILYGSLCIFHLTQWLYYVGDSDVFFSTYSVLVIALNAFILILLLVWSDGFRAVLNPVRDNGRDSNGRTGSHSSTNGS